MVSHNAFGECFTLTRFEISRLSNSPAARATVYNGYDTSHRLANIFHKCNNLCIKQNNEMAKF